MFHGTLSFIVVNINTFCPIVFPQMHTKKCEYLKIPCVHSECGMLVKKSALQEHLENECICRRQKCDYCKKDVKLNLMEVQWWKLNATFSWYHSQLPFTHNPLMYCMYETNGWLQRQYQLFFFILYVYSPNAYHYYYFLIICVLGSHWIAPLVTVSFPYN